MRYASSAGLMLVALSAGVSAQVAAPAAPAGPAAVTQPATPKKVCRRVESTGSILAARTCRLPAEWAAIDAQNGADAEAAMARRNHNLPGRQ